MAGFSVSAHLQGRAALWVTCNHTSISVNFRGDTVKASMDLIKALDWLCKTIRKPIEGNSVLVSAATCRVERRAVTLHDNPYQFRSSASQIYALRPYTSLKKIPLQQSQHDCWRLLFGSCLVVESTLCRNHSFGKGLELSFDLMVSLAAVEFCLNH